MPNSNLKVPILSFRSLNKDIPTDVAAVQQLLEAAPSYSLLVEGRLPKSGDALIAMQELPPGKTRNDKLFGSYWLDNVLVGCLDIVRGYPEQHIAFLGLLLFSEQYQGQGLGTQALSQAKDIARSWKCTTMRLAVVETNKRAISFWKREGFKELYRKATKRYMGNLLIMEIAL